MENKDTWSKIEEMKLGIINAINEIKPKIYDRRLNTANLTEIEEWDNLCVESSKVISTITKWQDKHFR